MNDFGSTGAPVETNICAQSQKVAVFMLLAAAFFWGSGNVANKTVLQDLDPIATVAGRNLVAVLALLPFTLRDIFKVPSLAAWVKSAFLPSALFAGAVMMQQWGYQSTTVSNASFLVNVACVLTPLIAFVLLGESMGVNIAIAALLTLVGAFLISGVGRSIATLNLGDVACLVSAAFYAGWMIALSRHAIVHGRPLATTFLHCLLTLVFAAILLLSFTPTQPGTFGGALPEVLYLGLFSTAIAFGLTAAAQARVSASAGAVLVAAESLFGAAGAILVLGERPSYLPILGFALMLLAIIIVARAPSLPSNKPAYAPEVQKELDQPPISIGVKAASDLRS
jgi:drug/metabolite transporter (DMT)-like permease